MAPLPSEPEVSVPVARSTLHTISVWVWPPKSMVVTPDDGELPIALRTVILLRVVPPVSKTNVLTAIQVRLLPVAVGMLGLVEMSVTLETVRSCKEEDAGK